MVAKIAHLAQRPLSWRQPTLRDQGIPGKKRALHLEKSWRSCARAKTSAAGGVHSLPRRRPARALRTRVRIDRGLEALGRVCCDGV